MEERVNNLEKRITGVEVMNDNRKKEKEGDKVVCVCVRR